jgi:hypothetical protein
VADRTSTAEGVSGIGVLLNRWFGLGGEMSIETVKAVGPFGVRPAEPVVHGGQPLELKSRRAALAVASPVDQASPLQHLEVLGDGGLRQGKGVCDHAGFAGREALEDRPAGGVGESGEALLTGS